MRQSEFESAVARATGESLKTIQNRGFSLIDLSARSVQRRGRRPRQATGRFPDRDMLDHDFDRENLF